MGLQRKRPSIKLKRLKELLYYNPLNGIFTHRKTTKHGRKGKRGGFVLGDYLAIKIDGETYSIHRLAWFYYYGHWPENEIDHRNRKGWCNWILNLRESTRSCNMRNTKNPKDNTSGIKGIYLNKSGNWYVGIGVNKKSKYLGTYRDFDEAVCTRLAAEQCLNWEGCDSLSPAYQYVKVNIQGVN